MIITNDEKALRLDCEPVTNSEVPALVARLEDELARSPVKGIGLAAPQIGIAKQIAIVRIDDHRFLNLVNCEISQEYDRFLFKEEGCLSFPDKKANIYRYNEIFVTGNLVYPHSFTATGVLAVCIQHEMDHINAITIGDREVKQVRKQGPNEKCLCGSGLKFKRCCWRKYE